ncbi:hypothetical protein CJF42_02925 [Pseudoalteromonas sp. NBT06-2]|uniref:di-heme oxidoreductase family protein n=1 Tax=Pseudoalteromonas sp. NBT06-2 TaxID=2025950 RepID=UPI000BA61F57|nr:di-heme oxidoredictase family protein [Pseudoalteromonas sp. NBT06-2]PAJ75812.1 hypothetical protein CJF42_02925 [Pseudoalteromonas sp. NBT06-2]
MKYIFMLLLMGCLCSCQPFNSSNDIPVFDISELKPGGQTTLEKLDKRTYIHSSPNLTMDMRMNFWSGFSFFRDPWVAAPASTTDRDGLGPLFNARSCIACHRSGGRGKLENKEIFKPVSVLFRLGNITDVNNYDPVYGGQIQPKAIRVLHDDLPKQVQGEAAVKLQYQYITGLFSDGTEYQLRKPLYELVKLGHNPLNEHTKVSARYAPAVYGMGLLDAIASEDLLQQEDINDENQDGISAKYNRVTDVELGINDAIGRFGFKALQPTLRQQVAAAFVNDIGITNPIFKYDTCTKSQIKCKVASGFSSLKGEALEIPEKFFAQTEYMSKFIAVPMSRDLKSKKAQKGRNIFYQLDCQNCHQPSYITANDYSESKLSGQKIWPYTDLALHDMGPGLADGKVEFLASGSEWRTPALWGIGLQQDIQGFQAYLHDGRARSIEEAILWHGGEAKMAQQAFIKLDKAQRDALIFFLKQI